MTFLLRLLFTFEGFFIFIVFGLSGACKYVEYDSRRALVVGGTANTCEQPEQWQRGGLPLGGRGWPVLCEANGETGG